MKKFIYVIVAVMLLVSLAGCGKEDEDPISEVDPAPTISQEELAAEVDFEAAETEGQIVTAESGEVFIESSVPPGSGDDTTAPSNASSSTGGASSASNPAATSAFRSVSAPEEVWADESTAYGVNSFTLPDEVLMQNGSLGTLTISKIGLTVPIYETDDAIEAMANGVAHMKETSCWTGNVGLAGHNRGVNTYFGRINELKDGDTITLTTALGTRNYKVVTSVVISDEDWSYLSRSDTNMITLITCVDNDASKRLCVQAVEA